MITIDDTVIVTNERLKIYGMTCHVTWISTQEGLLRVTPVVGDSMASYQLSFSEVAVVKQGR